MASDALTPNAPLSQEFREAVSAAIVDFVNEQAGVLDSMGPELTPVHLMASQLLCGGKRIRAAFCTWSYVAAAGVPQPDELGPLLTAAGSLEVLHGSALVHDDVMDASDLRRGRAAAHRQFEALHANAGWLGDSAAFGRAGAIVLGLAVLVLVSEVDLCARLREGEPGRSWNRERAGSCGPSR